MPSHRVEKLASTARFIVSDVIRCKLNDPRVATFTTVTRVELSSDLQVLKAFISVFGTEAEGRRTMAALQNARGRIQGFLAKGLRMRNCPELRIEYDDSDRKAAETMRIIEETMREHEKAAKQDPIDGTNGQEDIPSV